jgi:hypothetical protein
MRSPLRSRGVDGQPANAEFLPHYSGIVCENVTRIRVDPDYAINTDIEPFLFLDLADSRLSESLADVHCPAG